QAFDNSGNESNYSSTVSTYGQSLWKENSEEEIEVIQEYALNSNFPNPFNPTTQISYQLPKDGFVNLVVYNALGQEVAKLVNQHQSVGKYSVQFNASNLPSGVYIYKLQAGKFSSVKKMMLTK
ncbi:MAG: T9SS type A sorting domain-containing protein, partial [Bacteroidetes bacterium]|nr:T9SS type A sorting domain-containing protein [Bacteroidota bacterium]